MRITAHEAVEIANKNATKESDRIRMFVESTLEQINMGIRLQSESGLYSYSRVYNDLPMAVKSATQASLKQAGFKVNWVAVYPSGTIVLGNTVTKDWELTVTWGTPNE
jgi:hypothetical protein